MLRFASELDIIFTKILDDSFDQSIFLIKDSPEDFEDDFPLSSRCFSTELVINVFKDLQKYNAKKGLWFLNDYHYVLIYESLKIFCDSRNQIVADLKGEPVYIIDHY